MQELLKAAGKNVDRSAAIDLYNRTVTAEWRVNREGDVVAVYDNDRGSWKQTKGKADIKRAFDSDLKEEMEKRRPMKPMQRLLTVFSRSLYATEGKRT